MKWSTAMLSGDTRNRFSFTGLDSIISLAIVSVVVSLSGHLLAVALQLPARVTAVTFLDSHAVASDAGQVLAAPHWTTGASHPVCYTRRARPHLAVTLHTAPNFSGKTAIVAASADNGLQFYGTGCATGSSLVITRMTADRKLANAVTRYDPLTIAWWVSFDDGRSFHGAGRTRHRLYVTFDEPGLQPLRETLLDIGCRGASGCRDASTTVAGVWRQFSQRNADGTLPGLHRVDGHLLRYWLDEYTPLASRVVNQCHSLNAMLAPDANHGILEGVGTCQAWSELLESTLRAQGIRNVEVLSIVPPDLKTGFLINTLGFLGRHPPVIAQVIHGQGTPNPPYAFFNHSLVEVNGALYDPSYGNGPFTGPTLTEAVGAWETATVGALVRDEIYGMQTNRIVQPYLRDRVPAPIVAHL
ncbi:MAG: hypothetical protein WCS70_10830 [Verrucomicrobiota bacterium]